MVSNAQSTRKNKMSYWDKFRRSFTVCRMLKVSLSITKWLLCDLITNTLEKREPIQHWKISRITVCQWHPDEGCLKSERMIDSQLHELLKLINIWLMIDQWVQVNWLNVSRSSFTVNLKRNSIVSHRPRAGDYSLKWFFLLRINEEKAWVSLRLEHVYYLSIDRWYFPLNLLCNQSIKQPLSDETSIWYEFEKISLQMKNLQSYWENWSYVWVNLLAEDWENSSEILS